MVLGLGFGLVWCGFVFFFFGGGGFLVLCFGFFMLGFNGTVKTSTCKVRVSCLQDIQCEKRRLPGTKLVLLCTGSVHQGRI